MSLSNFICNNSLSGWLPVPRIEIAKPIGFASPLNPNGISHFVSTSDIFAEGNKVATRRMPLFIAEKIPQEFYSLDLRLEVLHYTNRAATSSRHARRGFHKPTHGTASIKTSPAAWPVSEIGYANPTGNTAPVVPRNPASRFDGGVDSQWGFVSEYGVHHETQQFLLDGMGSFFRTTYVDYFDGSTNSSQLLVIPRGACGTSGIPTRLSGISRQLRCGYFKFRLSIINPNNQRERMVGPTTGTMSIGYLRWPLERKFEQSIREGRGIAAVRAGSHEFTCWWNARTPGSI